MATKNEFDGSDASNDLPSSISPSLQLIHPSPEETLRHWGQNGAEWRGALSLSAYIRREAHLAAQDLTRDGGMTTWVLVDNADPAKRRVLAGCDTYRKKALICSDGKLTETVAHSIGSVFCPQEFRGKGYAGRMMEEVGEQLKSWQSDESLFSVLYSDIGKKFYTKYGWKAFPSSHISLPAETALASRNLPNAKPLYASDLPELCAKDESLIRESLDRVAGSSQHTIVAVIPDIQTMRWHHAREDFVGLELHGKSPETKGAIVGSEVGKRVWCYWTRMFYNEDVDKREENTLHILRLVVEGKGGADWETLSLEDEEMKQYLPSIAALFTMAQEEAAEWNMEDVQLWNPNPSVVEAAKSLYPSMRVVERDNESICSLQWYGKPESLNDIQWIGNEKYGWC